jgi:NitT/TauT family transport system substrate-binding protein
MRTAYFAVVASLVLLATGPARGQAPVLLRVGVENDAGAAALARVRDAGAFARAGISLDVVTLPRSSAGEAGIVNGALEIAAAAPTALAIAHDRNQPFSIIAAANVYHSDRPDTALIVARAARFARGRDFTDKTIGVPAVGGLASFATRAWVDRDGAVNVQQRDVAPDDAAAALDSGRIDGAVLSEPALSRALGTGKYRVAGRPYDAIGTRFITVAYYARNDWILANRDAIDRFITAMRQSDAPAVAPAEVQPAIAVLVRYALLPKAFPADQMIYPGALPGAPRGR